MLIRSGLVRNERGANIILVGVAIGAIALTILIWQLDRGETSEIEREINPVTGEEILPGQIPGQI